MLVNVLPDHNRIVDDDPQCHEEGEEAEHVERLVVEKKNRAGTEDRDGNTKCHPEGEPQIEKNGEYEKDQHQALDAVAHQHVDAVCHVDRLVGPIGELVTG